MKLQAMRLALSLTFERTLKSDLFLWAAQRGRDDFFFLLDGNTGMMAESVLGLYQQILKTGGKERQKVTRKGIQYDGKWYFSHELAMHLGEEVLVRPEGKYLTVSGTGGEIIEGFPF